MKKMRLVSAYTDYGNKDLWDESSPVKCVCDEQIWSNVREGKQVMALIEPRSIQPNVYDHVLEVYDQYEYVFTGDDELLRVLPNAKPIIWGGVWFRSCHPKKTKLICIVSSNKEMCELHEERKRIARKYKDKIDVYGTIDGGKYFNNNIHKDYMYEVVIENDIQDIWFTEKLGNCLANKTIPIYLGARNIKDYFDTKGMIICHNIEEVEKAIEKVIDKPYKDNGAIANYRILEESDILDKNYEISKQYEKFDEWFYRTYEKEIEELFDEES